ncbi:MAG: hypothetical protein AB7V16_13490 [Vulcanibacillus sp.]|jgi:hypothetical protein
MTKPVKPQNWAIHGDHGNGFMGTEEDMRRIWKKLDDGILTMPDPSRIFPNYRILIEIKDSRR